MKIGSWLIAGMAFILASGGCSRRAGDVSDSLRVQDIDSPARTGSGEPNLYAAGDGKIYLTWIESSPDGQSALRCAVRQQDGWSSPQTIAQGNDWLVNWADFPSLAVINDKSLVANWLVTSGDEKYAYDVQLALSNDGGKSWSGPIVPHRDDTATEHGFVSLLLWSDDDFLAVWLDGRNFASSSAGYAGHGEPANEMALIAALVDTTGDLSEEILLDPRVCECCQTSATLTSNGAAIVYRDRSSDEVRDIGIVRFQNGRWIEPEIIYNDNWKIEGCPVNGPAVDAHGERVAVAWYTGANDISRVNAAFSNDGGASFGQPLQVDDGNPMGRVDVIMLSDSSALVCWLEQNGEVGEIRARRISSAGARGSSMTIAETSPQRASGFPRMARNDEEIIFTWTDAGDPSQVRTAAAKISAAN